MDSSKITKRDNILQFVPERGKYRNSKIYSLIEDIKAALKNLLETGEETIIDFTNYPCDEECEEAIKEILGKGEVTASLNIFGCDSIIETGVHGVWWVHHLNDTGAILTKALYISYVPSILPAQPDDVEYSINVLSRRQLDKLN